MIALLATSTSAPAAAAVETAAQAVEGSNLVLMLTIFALAIFVGFEIITKVPPTLHTPLMSGSNAISGITLIGALILAAEQKTVFATIFGVVAVALATINVVGGFMVSHRMLGMFRRKG